MPKHYCMSAAKLERAELTRLNYDPPLIAQPKIDGLRALLIDGKFLSREMKPHANPILHGWATLLQEAVGRGEALDGEFIIDKKGENRQFTDTFSLVKTHGADISSLQYVVFDRMAGGGGGYKERFLDWIKQFRRLPQTRAVWSEYVHHPEDAHDAMDRFIKEGHEGLMLRDPRFPYELKRATISRPALVKVKDRREGIATVVGWAREVDKHGAAKFPERLGAFRCEFGGARFKIGSGFTAQERLDLWANPPKKVEFCFQELSEKGVPRFPIFKRVVGDLSR